MAMKKLARRIAAVVVASGMTVSMGAGAVAATAVPVMATASFNGADSNNHSNSSAVTQDLTDSDIIDTSKKGSITIHKYDITAAEKKTNFKEGKYTANGQTDAQLESDLSNYAIKNVEFSYLKVGDLEQYTKDGKLYVVYEIPKQLETILKSTTASAKKLGQPTDMTGLTYTEENGTKTLACVHSSTAADGTNNTNADNNLVHYTSTQIEDALQQILDDDDVKAKNQLEAYLHNYDTQDTDADDSNTTASDSNTNHKSNGQKNHAVGTIMTDTTGTAKASNLPLGLYLIVETRVPQQITDTVNPWFATLPFTNTDQNKTSNGTKTSEDGGLKWLYDGVYYPKNQTGAATIDKKVRNAYNNSKEDFSDKNGSTQRSSAYLGSLSSKALITFNADQENGNGTEAQPSSADKSTDGLNKQYVANRGGYTKDNQQTAGAGTQATEQAAIATTKTGDGNTVFSTDYEYKDNTTASEGDLLDYIIVMKLPHITSSATYLSEYTITDEMEQGLTYSDDFKVAFYDNLADAKVNNTTNAVEIWNSQVDHTKKGTTKLVTSSKATNENSTGYATVYTKEEKNSNPKQGVNGRVIQMTEAGLKRINGTNDHEHASKTSTTGNKKSGNGNGFSDYYMVLYYTAKVNSDSTVTLGDAGNQNNVQLLWSRTKNTHKTGEPDDPNPDDPDSPGDSETIEDRTYVYTYGLDLKKLFSGDYTPDDFSKVQFKLYNRTDGYYVVADQPKSNNKAVAGEYDVTGKNVSKTQGTTFSPNTNGKLQIRGLEADTYQLTEVATANGYNTLKNNIDIVINTSDRSITPTLSNDGGVNGNALSVGDITPASATVDGQSATMHANTDSNILETNSKTSANGSVYVEITNTKGFHLPNTGGVGFSLIVIIGVVAVVVEISSKRRKQETAQ